MGQRHASSKRLLNTLPQSTGSADAEHGPMFTIRTKGLFRYNGACYCMFDPFYQLEPTVSFAVCYATRMVRLPNGLMGDSSPFPVGQYRRPPRQNAFRSLALRLPVINVRHLLLKGTDHLLEVLPHF
jgi:hypothetical protein